MPRVSRLLRAYLSWPAGYQGCKFPPCANCAPKAKGTVLIALMMKNLIRRMWRAELPTVGAVARDRIGRVLARNPGPNGG